MAQRKTLFTNRVPLIQRKGDALPVHPDLFLMLRNGKIMQYGLNDRADLRRLISLVDDVLYELRQLDRSRKAKK